MMISKRMKNKSKNKMTRKKMMIWTCTASMWMDDAIWSNNKIVFNNRIRLDNNIRYDTKIGCNVYGIMRLVNFSILHLYTSV